ncbi:MAG: hypothetical protein DM484_01875 [Candidatus Methylumidiphilus alinenensis]|uniref:Uncharacterized protein n=1 Tax=Candidatus Methylumidiphilus alinenensis TaxID=2202197 RepID=A0A2W4TCP5_9GAMM|nr:MAG: hypothetical protein DM484_01875 [Candidatus Methylumidiphilus alinenensis]
MSRVKPENDHQKILEFLHKTYFFIGIQDQDAEIYDEAFDAFNRLTRQNNTYAKKLIARSEFVSAAEISVNISKYLYNSYNQIMIPPTSALPIFNLWRLTFERYAAYTLLRYKMAEKNKFSLFRPQQILLFIRYIKFGNSLKKAYKELTRYSNNIGVSSCEISKWMYEGKQSYHEHT